MSLELNLDPHVHGGNTQSSSKGSSSLRKVSVVESWLLTVSSMSGLVFTLATTLAVDRDRHVSLFSLFLYYSPD